MCYRILLSVVILSISFFLSCGLLSPTNGNDPSPIIHNDLVFSIQENVIAIPGQNITVDVNMQNFSDSAYILGGFDVYLAYDLNALTFDSLTTGQMITYCGWFYYTYRHYIDTIDGNEIGTVRIVSISDHYFADPICYTPTDSSTNQIARLHFSIKNDKSLRNQTVPIRFFWKDCGDNIVVDIIGIDYYLSNKIITNGLDVSSYNSFPNFTGHSSICDSILEDRNADYFNIVDFINGSVRIR